MRIKEQKTRLTIQEHDDDDDDDEIWMDVTTVKGCLYQCFSNSRPRTAAYTRHVFHNTKYQWEIIITSVNSLKQGKDINLH